MSDAITRRILKFLRGPYDGWLVHGWATWWDGWDNPMPPSSVMNVMPKGTTRYQSLDVMRDLHAKGFVRGCTCGCRGDFYITALGKEELARLTTIKKKKAKT